MASRKGRVPAPTPSLAWPLSAHVMTLSPRLPPSDGHVAPWSTPTDEDADRPRLGGWIERDPEPAALHSIATPILSLRRRERGGEGQGESVCEERARGEKKEAKTASRASMGLSWRRMTAVACAGSALVVWRYGERCRGRLAELLAALWLAQAVAWAIWSTFVYPHWVSPLRHLPQPEGAHWLLGHGRQMVGGAPPGAAMRQWSVLRPMRAADKGGGGASGPRLTEAGSRTRSTTA